MDWRTERGGESLGLTDMSDLTDRANQTDNRLFLFRVQLHIAPERLPVSLSPSLPIFSSLFHLNPLQYGVIFACCCYLDCYQAFAVRG